MTIFPELVAASSLHLANSIRETRDSTVSNHAVVALHNLGFGILLVDGRKTQIVLWTAWNALLMQALKDVSRKLFRECNMEAVFYFCFISKCYD